ncbi:MAG: oligoribonuclease [Candidatus Babeliales bacterium]
MKKSHSYLVWIDLEMTGLTALEDSILEIATVITDAELTIVAHKSSIVIHQPEEVLAAMTEWAKEQHAQSGLIDLVRSSTVSLKQAEIETQRFIEEYCYPQTAVLCGNSVWQDASFLRVHMPSVISFLHYRIIDVTSFKEALSRWYPSSFYKEFMKKDTHRALEDILESIEELRYYRDNYFVKF